MTNLKPCPFCGGKAKTEFLDVDKSNEKIHSAFCVDDDCVGSNCMWADFPTKEDAIKAWNTRADDKRVVKLLEAASKVVTTMVAVSQEGMPYEKHVDAVVDMNKILDEIELGKKGYFEND